VLIFAAKKLMYTQLLLEIVLLYFFLNQILPKFFKSQLGFMANLNETKNRSYFVLKKKLM
jgi:hypothetical protein